MSDNLKLWAPIVLSYVVAALLGWGLLGGRVSVIENTSIDHARRISILETQSQETIRVLSRVEALLERLERSEQPQVERVTPSIGR